MTGRTMLAVAMAVGLAMPALAATPVSIGMSDWTGFAPLTLAVEAGIYEKLGLDVTIAKIPQKDRPMAIASGAIQCAVTTVETWIVWNSNGVPTRQIFQLDKSHGADGIAVREGTSSIAELRGKTVAAGAPGTSPYFLLAWMLEKNGLSIKDVEVVDLEPAAAAQAFVAGQYDAAVSYEPYLSIIRDDPEAGRILATTLDYPVIMDTFGCTPRFIEDHPEAAKALTRGYFQALGMIDREKDKAYGIMGADVQQSGEEFGRSASGLRWQGRAANQTFFKEEFMSFSEEAAELLLEIGVIRQIPDLETIVDTRFID